MILATFIAMACVLVALAIAIRASPALKGVVDELGDREPQIDGLRGLCALVVAAHHLVLLMESSVGGVWGISAGDHVLDTMGKGAVAYFFLICAYLFWGKLARAQAAGAPLDYQALLQGRVFRLVPAYLFAMVFSMAVVGFWSQDFERHQSYAMTIVQIVQSLTFSFFGIPLFNGSFVASTAVGVAWSLRYEWLFYLSLPLIYVLKLRRHWVVLLPLLIAVNVWVLHIPYVEYFVYGAIAYELSRSRTVSDILAAGFSDFASFALFAGATCCYRNPDVESGIAPLLIAASFLPIACGARWGGLLRCDATRFVGAASYSLYLLNIPVFCILGSVFYDLGHGGPRLILAETAYLLGAIVFSLMIYRLVERPFMRKQAKAEVCRKHIPLVASLGGGAAADAAPRAA